MNIAEEFAKRKAQLEQELKLLNENNLHALLDEKKALESQLDGINKKIAHACATIGIVLPDASGKSEPRKVRLPPEELKSRVLVVLREHTQGLSQMEISEKSGVPYPSVVAFLKGPNDMIRSEGAARSKRFFLATPMETPPVTE